MLRKIIYLSPILLLLFVLSSCSTGSAIIVGEKRPAIDPAEVKLYLEEPSVKFEVIGLVESSSEVGFSRQAAQDRVIEELKKRAAAIGANGIVLTNTSTENTGGTGSGVHFGSTYGTNPQVGINSFFGDTSSTFIKAQAKAIFIENKE